ncbi:TonB-dependent receptor [Gluconobacter albidus]|uniref:TonB-dependent receptor n=1 Tax=Gluconobacter albidus TaxID=318683 RepID=A0AAW3R0E5_9PROT|nr:TonB-dependent receptor [Gluconobacter albidus]KXV41656.1 TonB-dependent receptor [Gluconobacter albidus]MCP1274399.1 TonB-dependent receptor [Gluconobacter albidus]GBQ83003.1 TonB-dependent receptor [Gluconobacter albidus NBRC 3250]GLQ69889.1 TonB-dependent receptor [Gluconobacter albidus]
MKKNGVLLTTCLSSLVFYSAHAAPVPAKTSSHGDAAQHRTPRPAPQKAAARKSSTPDAAISNKSESIVVLGSGASRETQTLSHLALQEVAPGTSPLKTLSKLPGVMFTSSDPLGAYEWSQQIIIRGFDQSRLGFTMDGIPLGNLAYGNDNGLSIGRALQTENNGPATLAQGAGSVGVAASNDLGGALEFTSIDPTTKYGVDVAGTVGSYGTWRTFARVNSGTLPGGGRLYVSYDYQDANKWKGDGIQQQQQANAKFIQPLGEKVKLTLFGDYSQRAENDYQDLSLQLIHTRGYNVDNVTNDYGLAKQIARAYQNGTAFPQGITNQDQSYYNSAGLRQDALGYGRLDFDITSRLKGYATVYGHTNTGEGIYATPYEPTPDSLGGSPISVRTTEYDIHREGFIGGLTYKIAHHTIDGGFWFENNDFEQARRFYPLSESGYTGSSVHWFRNNPFATQWQSAFNTKTYQFHLQDTWQITPAFKLNYGFKSLVVDNHARQLEGNYMGTPVANTYAGGSITSANGFLPQLGGNYRINRHNEIFADFARNMAAFDNSTTGATSPFAMTTAAYAAAKNSLHPEMSYSEEIGYRYHDHRIQASLTGYYIEFENRLASISPVSSGTNVQGYASILSNVGGVTARGIDAAFNYHFTDNWSIYASYAYNQSTYDDNLTTGGVTYATKGKSVVAMPRNLANVQLSYDDGSIWGNVGMQYQGRRTYTYTNDQWIKPNDIFNLNVGYRFHSHNWVLHGLDAQINVTNLFDKRYVATVGSTGFAVSDPTGSLQTLQAGAPRMVFFTLRKHFF